MKKAVPMICMLIGMLFLLMLAVLDCLPSVCYYFGVSLPFGVIVLLMILVLGVLQAFMAWRVWLSSLWIVFFLSWLVAPFIWLWFPDFFYNTHFVGVVFLELLVTLVFSGIYYVVVPVLWSDTNSDASDLLPVYELAPEDGKTVSELKDGLFLPPRNFLFGSSDRELVLKWGAIGRAMLQMDSKRKKRGWSIFLAVLCWPVLFFFGTGGGKGEFERDLDRMWRTEVLRNHEVVATKSAVYAARRVFGNELAFRGLTRDEAKKLLHFERMNPLYKLNKPQYSWQEDQMLLKISDGSESAALLVGYDDSGFIRVTWEDSSSTGNPIPVQSFNR